MTVNKQPISHQLIRRIPDQFSWIDHRLVRERYIDYLSHGAAALYLFLVTVSDAQGLSYYGDETLAKRLGMDRTHLADARKNLMRTNLLAYKKPLYQILALDRRREQPRSHLEATSVGDILTMLTGDNHDRL